MNGELVAQLTPAQRVDMIQKGYLLSKTKSLEKEKRNIYVIYYILNLTNDKFYVGSTKNLYKRITGYLWKLRRNEHANTILQNSFNKYGENNFIFGILEEVERQQYIELIEREQYYLDSFKPTLNVMTKAGVPKEFNHTQESKNLMRLNRKNSKYWLGKKRDLEDRIKIKNTAKVYFANKTEEEKQKLISQATNNLKNLGFKSPRNTVGYKQDETEKKKRSESIKLWWKERKQLKIVKI